MTQVFIVLGYVTGLQVSENGKNFSYFQYFKPACTISPEAPPNVCLKKILKYRSQIP